MALFKRSISPLYRGAILRIEIRKNSISPPANSKPKSAAANEYDTNIEKPFVSIAHDRTETTRKIWNIRKKILDGANSHKMPGLRSVPFPKSASLSTITIPLDFSNEEFRNEYVRHDDGIRLGKILEDIDALATSVAHEHTDDGNKFTTPLHIVTAVCDRIDLLKPFPNRKDLSMRGRVTWVGRSSLNMMVDISEKESENRVLEAQILMACRDSTTMKAVTINPLLCETDEEKLLYKVGIDLSKLRKKRIELALKVSAPTQEEINHIHSYFTSKAERRIPGSHSYFASKHCSDIVCIADTVLGSVIMTQPQEKNDHNKIFGG